MCKRLVCSFTQLSGLLEGGKKHNLCFMKFESCCKNYTFGCNKDTILLKYRIVTLGLNTQYTYS